MASQLEFLSERDDQIFVGAKMLDLGFHREPRVRSGQEEGVQGARISTCFKGLAQNFVLTCTDQHERGCAVRVRLCGVGVWVLGVENRRETNRTG